MGFPRTTISAICRQLGPSVAPLPIGIDGAQLLWALSGNESSFGANTTPRHEPAFDVGGLFFRSSTQQAELVHTFGSAAACSYGPWQVMFCNAPHGATPQSFDDAETAARISVAFLNSLLQRFQPQTLAEIGSCWNAGHIQHPLSAQVQVYADELAKNYAVVMP